MKAKARTAGVAAAAALLLMALAVPAQANRRLSPKAVIKEAINEHNAAEGAMSRQAKQNRSFPGDCFQQAAQPNPDWSLVEDDGRALKLEVKGDWRPYNKKIPKWVAALKDVKASGERQRRLKKGAIERLNQADGEANPRSGHPPEFFALDAEGDALINHDCQGAKDKFAAASDFGNGAWPDDGHGLSDAADLLHISETPNVASPYGK